MEKGQQFVPFCKYLKSKDIKAALHAEAAKKLLQTLLLTVSFYAHFVATAGVTQVRINPACAVHLMRTNHICSSVGAYI